MNKKDIIREKFTPVLNNAIENGKKYLFRYDLESEMEISIIDRLFNHLTYDGKLLYEVLKEKKVLIGKVAEFRRIVGKFETGNRKVYILTKTDEYKRKHSKKKADQNTADTSPSL